MPEMLFIPNEVEDQKPVANATATGTFTGQVYMLPKQADDQTKINEVLFTPGGRTYWHHHENGQMIRVTAGWGWICDKGGKPRKLNKGDLVWCGPDTEHWHGADEKSFLVHEVISYGKTTWQDPVSDEEYNQRLEK